MRYFGESIETLPLKVLEALHLEKFGRSGVVGSTVSTLDCAEIRIVLGAVASAPLRAYEAEKVLVGERLTIERVEVAAKLAAKWAN